MALKGLIYPVTFLSLTLTLGEAAIFAMGNVNTEEVAIRVCAHISPSNWSFLGTSGTLHASNHTNFRAFSSYGAFGNLGKKCPSSTYFASIYWKYFAID